MQEFQPEAVKWYSDHVEMNYIKWRYDGKSSPALDPALFFQKVSLAEAAQGLADVAENKTLNLFTANAIQGKNEFEKFKKIFELLQEMQVLIDKGITPPPALFAVPPDKKLGTAPDYRQIMNDLWNLQADNYRIFADFMEKNLTRRLLFHEYLGKFLYAPDRKNNYSNHIAEDYLSRFSRFCNEYGTDIFTAVRIFISRYFHQRNTFINIKFIRISDSFPLFVMVRVSIASK